MKIESTKGVLSLDEATLCFNVEAEGESWSWEKDYRPCFLAGEEKVFFSDAASIRHEAVKERHWQGHPEQLFRFYHCRREKRAGL